MTAANLGAPNPSAVTIRRTWGWKAIITILFLSFFLWSAIIGPHHHDVLNPPPEKFDRVLLMKKTISNDRKLLATGKKTDGRIVLYLHIFKTAGSSVRAMLRSTGMKVGFAANKCSKQVSNRGGSSTTYCLTDGHWRSREQALHAASQDIFAGHFHYGIQKDMDLKKQPIFMTTVRNPLLRSASAALYSNRKKYKNEAQAVEVLRQSFGSPLKKGLHSQRVGEIIARLTGSRANKNLRPDDPKHQAYIRAKVNEAKRNLDGFAIVGLTENFPVFVDMFVDMMIQQQRAAHRPNNASAEVWERVRARGKAREENTASVSTGRALARLAADDPALVRRYNETLRPEWELYAHGARRFRATCGRILGASDARCALPRPVEIPLAPPPGPAAALAAHQG